MSNGATATVRMAVKGQEGVNQAFDEMGQGGEKAARRWQNAYSRASADIERAIERQANAAAKIAAMAPGLNPTKLDRNIGVQYGISKSAQESAAVFASAYDIMETRARKLLATIDPAVAAQDRFNREIGEARSLVAAGAITLDQYCDKLRFERGLLDQSSAAHGRVGAASGQVKAGMQQLSFQINDVATMYAGGAKASTIFATQSGQVIQALGLIAGESKGILGILGGPWGMAFTSAAVVLAPFVGKLFEANTALADGIEKLRKDAEAAKIAEQAKANFGRTLVGLKAAIDEQAAALKKSERDSLDAADAAYHEAEARATLALRTREQTAALLEQVKAGLQADLADTKSPDINRQFRIRKAKEILPELEKRIAEANAAVTAAEAVVDTTAANLANERSKVAADSILKIKEQYKGLIAQAEKMATREERTNGVLERRLTLLRQQEAAAIEAEQKRQAAARSASATSAGAAVDAATGRELLAIAERYRGLDERRDGDALKSLFRQANINVDPKMTAWCAAFVNAVLAADGFTGTGSLGARSFLNFGQATDRPVEGDIVVLRRGKGDQGHVGFYQGRDKNGNILVLGGNTNARVGTGAYSPADVLGFRRVDAAKSLRDENSALRDQAAALAAVGKQFDPAAEAARKYQEDIANIAKAKLDPEQAAQFGILAAQQYDDALAKIRGEKAKSLFGFGPGDGIPGLDKAVDASLGLWRSDMAKRQDAQGELQDQTDRIALLQREIALVGENDNYRQAELNKLEVILDLKRKGRDAASEDGEAILANAEYYDVLLAKLREQEAAWAEVRQVGEGFIDTVLSPSNWSDWGALGKKVLQDIYAEFLKLAAINPLKNLLFGEDLPTIGGFFGRIFGHANGTERHAGGLALVGENGPELAALPAGTRVSTAGETRRLLAANDQRPVVVQLVVDEGAAFVPRVRAISGDVSIETISAVAPALQDGAAARALSVMTRRGI